MMKQTQTFREDEKKTFVPIKLPIVSKSPTINNILEKAKVQKNKINEPTITFV